MSLQADILTGLDVPHWDESIAAIKRAVTNALRHVDRSVQVKDTSYFNHSFVPDFVLSWPDDPSRQRDVYLRLDSSRAFLQRDVELLAREAPLLISLAPGWSEESAEPAIAPSATGRTLVTEPEAVERFGEASGDTHFGRVVPAAVLKGGKGWIDEPTADRVTEAASAFFAAASSHESEAVAAAAPAMTEYLDAPESGRVLNFGRIVWEATGGDATRYPLSTDLAGLDDAALRFLLEAGPPENATFWRSVGSMVELDRLVSVGVRQGPNLGAIVRANADRLLARAFLVRQAQETLGASSPEWSVESRALVLRGTDFAAYIGSRREDLPSQLDEGQPLDIETFRARAADEQVESVTVVAGDGKTVTIASEDMFDPSTDAVLASIGDIPGSAIASVGLIVAGKHLSCDFTSRLAVGHTNAQFSVVSLIERALPLLWPLSDDRDVAEVRRIRQVVSSVGQSPSLFDALGDD